MKITVTVPHAERSGTGLCQAPQEVTGKYCLETAERQAHIFVTWDGKACAICEHAFTDDESRRLLDTAVQAVMGYLVRQESEYLTIPMN